MADLGPSRPHHPTREGFAASRFSRESSVAHLGADFRPCSREVLRILRLFDLGGLNFQDVLDTQDSQLSIETAAGGCETAPPQGEADPSRSDGDASCL